MQSDDSSIDGRESDPDRFITFANDRNAILAELARMGFSNVLDYVRIGPDGLAEVDLSIINRDQAAAIDEIVVDYEGRDGESRVKRVRFKLADKRSALIDLGKYLGLFSERKAREQHVLDMSDEEVERRVRIVLAQAVAAGVDLGPLSGARDIPGTAREGDGG